MFTKPSVSPIFTGKSAEQGCNVLNFRKYHKAAQEVVDENLYNICQVFLKDTVSGTNEFQVKALDAVFSKSADDTFYSPASTQFKDPLIKIVGSGESTVVFSKKEYKTDWAIVPDKDDTPIDDAEYHDKDPLIVGSGPYAVVFSNKNSNKKWEIVATEDYVPTGSTEYHDEEKMAVKVSDPVKVFDTVDMPAQQQSTSTSKNKKPSEAPAAPAPTHQAASPAEPTFPPPSTAERLRIEHAKRQTVKHAAMWTDLKAKHKALAAANVPAGTTTTQRDHWIQVFVRVFPDMEDEERGARIVALRAQEASKTAKKNCTAKWTTPRTVSESVEDQIWAPVFLDLTKEWEKFIVNVKPKPKPVPQPIVPKLAKTANEVQVSDANPAKTTTAFGFGIPKTNFTFDEPVPFSWSAALEEARAESQQPSNPFANLSAVSEANKVTPTKPFCKGAAFFAAPLPPVTPSAKTPKDFKTPSIFDQPLPAGPSPFSNPFSKLTATPVSASTLSVLNDSSPSGSAFSNPFARVAASPSQLQNSKPYFHNATKNAEKKVAEADKTLPSSLTINGKFYVPASATFEFRPGRPEKLGGGGKEVEAAANAASTAAAEDVAEVAAPTAIAPTATASADEEVVMKAGPPTTLEDPQIAVDVQIETTDDSVTARAATAAPENVVVLGAELSVAIDDSQTAADVQIETTDVIVAAHAPTVTPEDVVVVEAEPQDASDESYICENVQPLAVSDDVEGDVNHGIQHADERSTLFELNASISTDPPNSVAVADAADQICETDVDSGTVAADAPPVTGGYEPPTVEDELSDATDPSSDAPYDVMNAYEWISMRGQEALSTVRPEELHLVHYVTPTADKDLHAPEINDASEKSELEDDNTTSDEPLAACESESCTTNDEPHLSGVLETIAHPPCEEETFTADEKSDALDISGVAQDLQDEDDASRVSAVAHDQLAICDHDIPATDGELHSLDFPNAAETFKYEDDANYGSGSAYEQLAAFDYDTPTTNDEPQSPIDSVFDSGISSDGTRASSPDLDIDPEAGTWVEYEPIQDTSIIQITHHCLPEVECVGDEESGLTVCDEAAGMVGVKLTHGRFRPSGPLFLDSISENGDGHVAIAEEDAQVDLTLMDHLTETADEVDVHDGAIELQESSICSTINAADAEHSNTDFSTEQHPTSALADTVGDAATIGNATEVLSEDDSCYRTASIMNTVGVLSTIYTTFCLPDPAQIPVANDLNQYQLELDSTPLEDLEHWASSTFNDAFGTSGAPQIPALDINNTPLHQLLDLNSFFTSSVHDQKPNTTTITEDDEPRPNYDSLSNQDARRAFFAKEDPLAKQNTILHGDQKQKNFESIGSMSESKDEELSRIWERQQYAIRRALRPDGVVGEAVSECTDHPSRTPPDSRRRAPFNFDFEDSRVDAPACMAFIDELLEDPSGEGLPPNGRKNGQVVIKLDKPSRTLPGSPTLFSPAATIAQLEQLDTTPTSPALPDSFEQIDDADHAHTSKRSLSELNRDRVRLLSSLRCF